MSAFDQNDIDDLISCPKYFADPPSKEMKIVGAHRRNDATLVAVDGRKGEFLMFMRKNVDFPENFSIGLRYNPQDGRGEVTLFRCNGKHGDFNRSFDPRHPHSDFHIHRASQAALEQGYAAEMNATKTSEFASYEEALLYFVKAVALNADDSRRYFPVKNQAEFGFE